MAEEKMLLEKKTLNSLRTDTARRYTLHRNTSKARICNNILNQQTQNEPLLKSGTVDNFSMRDGNVDGERFVRTQKKRKKEEEIKHTARINIVDDGGRHSVAD